MPTIALLGATGFAGRLVADELTRRGHRFVVIGRDGTAATRGRDDTVDVMDVGSLTRSLDDVDLVISAAGPFGILGRGVVDACIAARTHLVDIAVEQPYVRWVHEHANERAWAADVTLVPGAGSHALPGDLLAHLAAGAVRRPSEVHVAYAIRGGLLGAASAGMRRSIATMLGRHGVALDHGDLVEELPGEARRLAWFPRPVGPRHAAGIPGTEPITVPRHVPGVRTVRTYLAMSTWRAELLQFAASAARREGARRRLAASLQRGRVDPSEVVRAGTRWACVVEASGDGEVARAWAYGSDPAAFTAASAVLVAERVLGGHVDAGAVPPALVEVPGDLLDAVSARTGMRWAIARPDG